MLKSLLFIIPFISSSIAFGQFTTPNTGINWSLFELFTESDGAVTLNESGAYVFNEDITVAANDTLSILEDATVFGAAGKLLIINGTFLVQPDNGVEFLSENNSSVWHGFRFNAGSTLNINNLEADNIGSSVMNSPNEAVFSFCSFSNIQNTNGSALTDAVFRLNGGAPEFHSCFFADSPVKAFHANANQSVALKAFNNSFLNMATSGPTIQLGATPVNDTIVFIGNTLSRPSAATAPGGVSIATTLQTNVVFKENLVENLAWGLLLGGFNPTALVYGLVEENEFLNNNKIANPLSGGSGVSVQGTGAFAELRKNYFEGNHWGVTIVNAQANLGTLEDFGENSFKNNGNGGQVIALANNSSGNTLSAIGNCWLADEEYTLEDAQIVIQDQSTNPNFGPVIFEPFIQCIDAVSVTEISHNNLFSIFPNPALNYLNLLSVEPIRNYTIYSGVGQQVARKEFGKAANTELKIDLSNLPSGIYFITINDQPLEKNSKFVKL
jgi:hypothetical protein